MTHKKQIKIFYDLVSATVDYAVYYMFYIQTTKQTFYDNIAKNL